MLPAAGWLGGSCGRIDAGAIAKGDSGPGAAAEAGVADLCCTCRVTRGFQTIARAMDAAEAGVADFLLLLQDWKSMQVKH